MNRAMSPLCLSKESRESHIQSPSCLFRVTVMFISGIRSPRETSQAVERRPGQILERHDMAEDSTRQGHLETAC